MTHHILISDRQTRFLGDGALLARLAADVERGIAARGRTVLVAGPLSDRVDADALTRSHTRTAERVEQLLAAADRVWADEDAREALPANAAADTAWDAETEACATRVPAAIKQEV